MNPDDIRIPPGLQGLTRDDAARLLREHGPNRWVPHDRLAELREALGALLDPMAVMLAIAAVLYWLLGETRDAVILGIALIPVLGVDVLLEARSRSALKKLAAAASPAAHVVRDGRVMTVPLGEVVPGDLLALVEGHVAGADGTVLWAANLALDESGLTGESEPQAKRPATGDGPPAPETRLYAGSLAVTGHGFARITATGQRTAYGSIASLIAETPASQSPLQQHASRLARRLGAFAIGVAALLFAAGVWRGEPWTEALLGAVSLAMAAIPEEFPLVLTLFLSVGAFRLAGRGMLVRRLASVETLGATTVICTDKTGTLTRGEFVVTEHQLLDAALTEAGFLETALLACEHHPADAMEKALLDYAEARGVSHDAIVGRWSLLRDYDFDPVGKHMSHVWRDQASGGIVIAAKGALEGVLAHAAASPEERTQLIDANARMADRGLRVLAVAGRRAPEPGADRDEDECGLVVHGLIGFQDPLRPEVPAAVAECQRAGMQVKMITGDHALTAHAVAEAAGIVHDDATIVTGDELDALEEPARSARIAASAILARISPAQKLLIVDALKKMGAVVAMTGDGVNDAPALRRADIGIAMGRRGTDVARATADLVLLDDNFASIVATVREGRHIHQNIQRAFLYLVAFHIPIVVLAALVPLLGLPLLLLPIHLVWLELIVHPVSALVFQAEQATDAVMQHPPRDPKAPLFPPGAVWRSLTCGLLLTAATLAGYWWGLKAGDESAARAVALVVLMSGYQTLVFAERMALPKMQLPLVPRSRLFWGVWTVSALSLVAMLMIPGVAALFRVSPLPAFTLGWAVAAGVGAVAWRLVLRPPSR
ncbi:MAG: cation-transporting P-type ATPase [Vicinamibacterales bacterium]|nr:cation-transporting P-type ATPase [Vicinamibacterales bacterium]